MSPNTFYQKRFNILLAGKEDAFQGSSISVLNMAKKRGFEVEGPKLMTDTVGVLWNFVEWACLITTNSSF